MKIDPISLLNKWKSLYKDVKALENQFFWINKNLGLLLNRQYASQLAEKSQKEQLKSMEFRVHSQSGEDGLILYLFSQIGTGNLKAVEFGGGNGKECNTANLSLNFGWSTLLIEGDISRFNEAQEFYTKKDIFNNKVFIENQFITRENINSIIENAGFAGDIDLLSIDLDSNDYWIWESINCVNPRMVICEYNSTLGSENSWSIPYKSNFSRFDEHPSGWYYGASLSAFTHQANSRNYALVGCDSAGVNAFFVRKDLLNEVLKETTPKEAFYSQRLRLLKSNEKEQFSQVSELPWVDIH